MIICGMEKASLVDYDKKIAAVLFTGGCNMRCPFCHNAELVLATPEDALDEAEIFDYLEKRKGLIDAVVISGGEPTLQKDLIPFVEKVRETGLAVKLDTNGLRPDVLATLFGRNLLDYVAMDVKNSRKKYSMTAGTGVDFSAVSESIGLIMANAPDYEFRTTVIKELHTEEDIADIADRIAGAKKYFLQKYKDADTCFEHGFTAPSKVTALRFCEIASQKVDYVGLRGF